MQITDISLKILYKLKTLIVCCLALLEFIFKHLFEQRLQSSRSLCQMESKSRAMRRVPKILAVGVVADNDDVDVAVAVAVAVEVPLVVSVYCVVDIF